MRLYFALLAVAAAFTSGYALGHGYQTAAWVAPAVFTVVILILLAVIEILTDDNERTS